jgi:molecular chaperone GrpE
MNKNKTINDELLEELYDEQQEEQLTDTDTDSSQSKNDSMDELNKKLDESEKEKEQYKNKYLYTLAEFDNFKKRTAKEKLELKNIVISDMANKVFEIIDDNQEKITFHCILYVDIAFDGSTQCTKTFGRCQ